LLHDTIYICIACADPPFELSANAFEVLVGAAPGFAVRVAPWLPGSPTPPAGSVVVGVSAMGDPLLAGTAEVLLNGCRSIALGYVSTRERNIKVGIGDTVQNLVW
jgi:hypothetical protein